MKFLPPLILLQCVALYASEPLPLTHHLRSNADLGELRDLRADWSEGVLHLSTAKAEIHAWAVINAPKGGWDLATRSTINTDIANTGENPAGVLLWVVGDHGWEAVTDAAVIAPGQTRTFSCKLRETFPDGTPKLNPNAIKQIQVMLSEPAGLTPKQPENAGAPPRLLARITKPVSIQVRNLTAQGDAPQWKRPEGRLDVPNVESSAPAPGKRVRYRLADDAPNGPYCVLNLPENWRAGAAHPVVVEFPGNIFFTPGCYSTGMPEQCVMGYGMTKGRDAICLGMPFVNRSSANPVESGWGNPDDTAQYTMQIVDEVCAKFGGDRKNIVLAGFSRGAIACGYIGLRNAQIASLWKGFHACQHYDGDGWNGATLPGALERAERFRGKAVFQTDNPEGKFKQIMDVMKTDVTWVKSGLGAHSTAMFLDDRPSTQKLREWFLQLVEKSQP
jgi:hypothetical protein